jgi:hypothetical protein
MDYDIHVYSVVYDDDLKDLALTNAQKHFGYVIQSQHIIELNDAHEQNETDAKFRAERLVARIEIAPGQFAFWKPDDSEYRTQSEPK